MNTALLQAARDELAAIDRMLSNSGIAADYPTDALDELLRTPALAVPEPQLAASGSAPSTLQPDSQEGAL